MEGGIPLDTPRLHLTLALTAGLLTLAGALLLLGMLGQPPTAQANPGTLYVAPTGDDSNPCSSSQPCRTVQHAVDVAASGDEIRVASGVYSDVSVYPRADITTTGIVTQVVYISKTVTIRGGYSPDFSAWNPDANPSTLDAQGKGRVLYITGNISPTIEGLRITGGNAAGMGGSFWGFDTGGGMYVITAAGTFSNTWVFNNSAAIGGGLYLGQSSATISSNIVASNTATWGGGPYLYQSPATLSGNTVTSNTADSDGGGLYLYSSPATLSGNTVISNVAKYGGGLNLNFSDNAIIRDNTIFSNMARNSGGGVNLYQSAAVLNGNRVFSNTAPSGGGLYLLYSAAALNGNIIISNTATSSGGGLYLWGSSSILTNNVIADNRANSGNGLYIAGSSPGVLHTTIARNTGGDGSGIFITNIAATRSTVALTNTILISQTVGITVTTGTTNTATLNGVLWYSNTTNYGGPGAITVTNAITGNPAFAADGYHLTAFSAAIDQGVDAGVTTDIDGQTRPIGRPDLGADEWGMRVFLPLVLKKPM